MVFTCGACETRAVKTFTRRAYDKGIVIVTCPGCQNKHLVADNLGWFGDNTNVETLLAERGEEVKQLASDGQIELDELMGASPQVLTAHCDLQSACACWHGASSAVATPEQCACCTPCECIAVHSIAYVTASNWCVQEQTTDGNAKTPSLE